MLNIYCFKWGDKYGPEYVNRLYASLKKYCTIPFKFHCITDDSNLLNFNICIIDFNDFTHMPMFAGEKIFLFNRFNTGINILLDIDILIHNNIDHILGENHVPTFIQTHWEKDYPFSNYEKRIGKVLINSSFVKWTNKNAEFLTNHFLQNKDLMLNSYRTFDKYVYYEFYNTNKINFWDNKLFYSYNHIGAKRVYQEKSVCCLFNTSHDVLNSFDLHNTVDWAIDIWESYDDV